MGKIFLKVKWFQSRWFYRKFEPKRRSNEGNLTLHFWKILLYIFTYVLMFECYQIKVVQFKCFENSFYLLMYMFWKRLTCIHFEVKVHNLHECTIFCSVRGLLQKFCWLSKKPICLQNANLMFRSKVDEHELV